MNQKQDLRERCSYLLILFKAKDMALFEKYTAQLAKISAEESTEFYHYLLAEYKKMVEGPAFTNVSSPKAVIVKEEKKQMKVAKKKPATKKVSAKKKPTKKITKKVAKKATKKVATKNKKITVKKVKKR